VPAWSAKECPVAQPDRLVGAQWVVCSSGVGKQKSEALLSVPLGDQRHLSGERTPYADPLARACFVGLTLAHTRGHMIRSIMEGVSYAMRDSLAIIEACGVPVKQIRGSGGGSRSPEWRQIQANVFGQKVDVDLTFRTKAP